MSELREGLLVEVEAMPAVEQLELDVPLHVLLGEATELAAYVRRVWGARRFDESITEDLPALVRAVQAEHAALRLAAEPPKRHTAVKRGEALVVELTAALEFLFDDGVEDERDAQLDAIGGVYGSASHSEDALAAALFEFGTLANEHREQLDGLGGFEVGDIDEALALAQVVRGRSEHSPSAQAEAAQGHRLRRNQLVTLLQRKLALVRGAARPPSLTASGGVRGTCLSTTGTRGRTNGGR